MVPHFAVPFTVSGGAPLEVEQDTREEIGQCIRAVLHTIEETWVDEPEFGIPDRAFAQQVPNPDAVVYTTAVERWEPRSEVVGEAFVADAVERNVIQQEA